MVGLLSLVPCRANRIGFLLKETGKKSGEKEERMDISFQRIHGAVFPDITEVPALNMDMLGDSGSRILLKSYDYIL